MNCSVEDNAVPLVIVGPSIVPPNIGVVDGRTEKEFTRVTQGLRVCVRNAVVSPANRPLQEGYVESVIVRVRQRGVLAVIREGKVGTAAVVIPRSRACRRVLID